MWKTKKGERVLEESGVICKVAADGSYKIRNQSGAWEHAKAASKEAAIILCEEFVVSCKNKKALKKANRSEVAEKAKFFDTVQGAKESRKV